eukprot:3460417-Amphidinium_carterae.1
MIACERQQNQGVVVTDCKGAAVVTDCKGAAVVTDCKGAAVVANKLKNGLRRPRGRHSRIEHRLQEASGDIRVQWMPSHQAAQQGRRCRKCQHCPLN